MKIGCKLSVTIETADVVTENHVRPGHHPESGRVVCFLFDTYLVALVRLTNSSSCFHKAPRHVQVALLTRDMEGSRSIIPDLISAFSSLPLLVHSLPLPVHSKLQSCTVSRCRMMCLLSAKLSLSE